MDYTVIKKKVGELVEGGCEKNKIVKAIKVTTGLPLADMKLH